MFSELGVRPRRRRLGGLSILVAVGLAVVGSAAGVAPTEEPVAMAARGTAPAGAPAATPPTATPPAALGAAAPSRPAPVPAHAAESTPPAAEPPTRVGEAPRPHDVPNEWIVELNPDVSADAVATEHAESEGADVHHVYSDAVDGYSATMSDGEAANVANDPRVAAVTRDRMVYATAQTLPVGIKRIGAPLSGAGVSVDVDVAVVDTGIASHPDLAIAGGKNCIGSATSYADDNGHGTHVAGTIAARNDTAGVVGVAPGARLWGVKVLDEDGSGTWSEIICGLNWVRAQGGIEVVNMSLSGSGSEGSSCSSSTLRSAICNLKAAGVTVVVAAGNESTDSNGSVPATYPEVVTVSALVDTDGLAGGLGPSTCGADDTFASFSNYGADVDVVAPGGCVYSTYTGGGYRTMSGTSMATPHVAGVAALYKSSNPAATPDDVRSHLISTGSAEWNNSRDRDAIKEPLAMAAAPAPAPEAPPTPSFTVSCTNLACSFTDASTATNGDAITSWAWKFGAADATAASQNSSYTYAAAGTYAVELTVSDNDGSASVTKQVTVSASPSIALSLARVRSSSTKVRLTWSGATGSKVEIWRKRSTDGSFRKITTTSNDGTETNDPNNGTWDYKICQTGGTVCSPVQTITV